MDKEVVGDIFREILWFCKNSAFQKSKESLYANSKYLFKKLKCKQVDHVIKESKLLF